jgi:hypothetical protein
VSSLPVDDFPPTFARKCTKMALESPSTVFRTAKKNLENVSKSQLEMGGFF